MASMLKRLSMRSGGDSAAQKAFKENLSQEAIDFFNEAASKPFSEQAVAFLNAYWEEIGDQAEFIFSVAWEMIKYADMHSKGVNYIHLYDEGVDLEFNIGLYFYEKLCKLVLDDPEGKKWRDDPHYAISMPEMMTAIVRKKELRDKVDVNFDGKISFLEYLLYQYRSVTNPAEFTKRAMSKKEHPKVVAARLALDEVNKAIKAYEQEKARLEELSKSDGVKGLGAKHQLTMLLSSPIAEELQVALIKAEAAVRLAVKAAKAEMGDDQFGPNSGSTWWLQRDLQKKKEMYGAKRK